MEALGAAGVPVVAERGTGGGWSLLDGYETRLTGLNQAEVQALFLGESTQLLGDLGLQQAAAAARLRLMAALPSAGRRDAEFVRQRILVDGAPWHPQAGEDLSLLPLLQEAIWQERKLHLRYERSDGSSVERLVDPLGLVAKGRTWYLVAAVAGEPHSYLVSRVRAATLAEAACVRPPDFDLAAFWARSAHQFIAQLPRFSATLRLDPELLPTLRYRLRFAQVAATAAGVVRLYAGAAAPAPVNESPGTGVEGMAESLGGTGECPP